MDVRATPRGFGRVEFVDRYGQRCSLQESSLASERAVWFGVDNTGPDLYGPGGRCNENVGARMHLTRATVRELMPHLMAFAYGDGSISIPDLTIPDDEP